MVTYLHNQIQNLGFLARPEISALDVRLSDLAAPEKNNLQVQSVEYHAEKRERKRRQDSRLSGTAYAIRLKDEIV